AILTQCFELPRAHAHQHLPSFPTRRSSDLRALPDGERAREHSPAHALARAKPRMFEPRERAGRVPKSRPCETRSVRVSGFGPPRSEEHTSELQSLAYLVCRLLLEKKIMKLI